jgi:hypothetical protein
MALGQQQQDDAAVDEHDADRGAVEEDVTGSRQRRATATGST